tara:strand:+ start:878 stop:2086 length:1209 start_codon:yes stop_codon:yes gene_type:complete
MVKKSALKKIYKKIKKTGLVKKLLLKKGGAGFDDIITIIPAENEDYEPFTQACEEYEIKFTNLNNDDDDGKWKMITLDGTDDEEFICSDFAKFIKMLNKKYPNGISPVQISDDSIYGEGTYVLSGQNLSNKLDEFCKINKNLKSCKNNEPILKHIIRNNPAEAWETHEGQKILSDFNKVVKYYMTARYVSKKKKIPEIIETGYWNMFVIPVVKYINISNDFKERVKDISFPNDEPTKKTFPSTFGQYIEIMKEYKSEHDFGDNINRKWSEYVADHQPWGRNVVDFINFYGKYKYPAPKNVTVDEVNEEYKNYILKNGVVSLEELAQFLFEDEDEEEVAGEEEDINENIGGKKKRKTNGDKRARKHRGIVQIGGNKGRLRKGYRYSGKRLKSGLPQIIKCKKR